MNDILTAADHVTTLLSSCSSLLYAMQVLRSHGTPTTSLHDIFQAIVVTRIQYAAPSWSGKRLGYCSNDVPTVTELFNSADNDFFYSVKTNSTHVLQLYFPDQTNMPYCLCTRLHNMTMINKTKFVNDTNFIIRMLYKYSY